MLYSIWLTAVSRLYFGFQITTMESRSSFCYVYLVFSDSTRLSLAQGVLSIMAYMALVERGNFFRLQVYKTVGIAQVK